jgi:SurA-like protein
MLFRVLVMALCFPVVFGFAGPGQSRAKSSVASGRTIERVVAVVDGAAITRSDVEAEYRTEVFLEEGRVPPAVPDTQTFSHVLDRLIDQRLLTVEGGTAGHQDSAASEERAELTLAQLRKRFAAEENFQAALRSLGLNEDDLLAKVEQQERILQVVDQRLRPLVSVGADEIEAYYRKTFVREWAKKSKGDPPPLAEVEDQIQEILVQRKMDRQLEDWLKELRAAHRVRYISDSSP